MLNANINKPLKLITFSVLSLSLFLAACQPKGDAKTDGNKQTAEHDANHESAHYYIVSKTVNVPLNQKKKCFDDGCTQYDFQTVETNHAWINQYFINRIKKMDPLAFDKVGKAPDKAVAEKDISQSSINVRYIGQNQHIAIFELFSYTYPAGAAHGMYHREYVNFDLKTKKRIALSDLIQKDAEAKLKKELYENNRNWLEEHSISEDKFTVSDNFYYGADGIVFVYPLYELASYAEGMTELKLSYFSTADLIESKFLPN